MGFVFRKMADKSSGTRVEGFHPETGQKVLINPESNAPEPWPLAGVKFDREAPDKGELPMKQAIRAKYEGWLEFEGETIRQEPGGPPEDPWRVTHTFTQAHAVIFKMADHNYRYIVKRSPGVYNTMQGREIVWNFELERANV